MKIRKYHTWQQRPVHISNQAGFTLIEFLIASALSMLIIIAVGTTYSMTARMKQAAESRLALQQDLRSVSEQITRDARMAGSFGCFSSGNLISKVQVEPDGNAFNNKFQNNGIKYSLADDRNVGLVTVGFANATNNINGADGQRLINSLNATGFNTVGGKVIAFTYGLNATMVDTDGNKAVISNANSNGSPNALALFNWVQEGGAVALASCNRLYLSDDAQISGSNVEVENADNIKFAQDNKLITFNRSQTMLSQLYSVAYAVGTVGDDVTTQGLYKFTMNAAGGWDGPQLVSLNVTDMDGEVIYARCSSNRTDATFSSNPNELPTTDATRRSKLPTLVELYLTLNNDNANVEKRGNMTEYVIRASVRGGNICSDT